MSPHAGAAAGGTDRRSGIRKDLDPPLFQSNIEYFVRGGNDHQADAVMNFFTLEQFCR